MKTVIFSSHFIPPMMMVITIIILHGETTCIGVKSKLHSIIFAIRRLKQIVGKETAKHIYYALFHSKMTYGIDCIEVWGTSFHMNEILPAQKEAIRALEGMSPITHCKPLFMKTNILTVVAEHIIRLILDVSKI